MRLVLSIIASTTLAGGIGATPLISGQPIAPPSSEPGAHFWSKGHSGFEFPAGIADVFGNGPLDLFISMEEVLPFQSFDTDGAPLYGETVSISNGAGNGRLILSSDEDVIALFWSGKTISTRTLDKDSMTFVNGSSKTLSLPSSIQRAAGMIRPDGKLIVALTLADGEAYNVETPPDADSQAFRPYDGQGRWRGGVPGFQLYTVLMSSTALGSPLYHGPAHGSEKTFLFSNPSLTYIQSPESENRTILAGTDKSGIVRFFEILDDGTIQKDRQFVANSEGAALLHKTISPNACAAPADANSWSDLFIGDTGLMWYYPYSGTTTPSGIPIYNPPVRPRQTGVEHRLGDLPVISLGDINGDGAVDILGGNDGGHLFWMQNVGTATTPEFSVPEAISVEGEELIVRPGPTGSLQGPTETAWGYTCPTLYDWNKDGSLDIILSSSLGEVHVLFQESANPPVYTKPAPIYCDGLPLAITWRQQVAVTDWGIAGNDQLVTSDEQDFFRVFHRLDDHNVERGEYLRLDNGSVITANYRYSGQYGRTKLIVADWDGDGVNDILAGVRRAHSIPNDVTGLPQSVGGDRQSGALFLKNTGTNAAPEFAFPESFHFKGNLIELGAHSTSVAAWDFGNGLDLLISEETGSVIYYGHEDLEP